MNWCDSLAAVPAIGIKLTPKFVSSDELVSAISPIITEYYEDDKPKFTVQTESSEGSVTISTHKGTYYNLDPVRISIGFQHFYATTRKSGMAPEVKMMSNFINYSSKLEELIDDMVRVYDLINPQNSRQLLRIGVVSTLDVDEDLLPPGMKKMIEYLSKPWDHGLDGYDYSITGILKKDRNRKDRCIHRLIKNSDPLEEERGLIKISLDWQRVFNTPEEATGRALRSKLEDASKDAGSYIDSIGEGSRFDEDAS